jgi:hypothetical protein
MLVEVGNHEFLGSLDGGVEADPNVLSEDDF